MAQIETNANGNYMLAKFETNACGILFSWRDNSSLTLIKSQYPGSVVPLAMFMCPALLVFLQSKVYKDDF